ncbi:PP2C family protein-serine/threonine phosphatase [Chromobacterium sp. IIBBL 290-4]|uniref:PP2C family protein-serine/threonine phosphatase n=1 Tax=Chromobacterium sp. IIBBL 290-4 TaxID=2953890 RepID=UPI0020B75596|nr:SpoIIE family protein phosphatase [Chromobacterium sp. IIBBL 290-4]UTH72600.1 SpoIIE family protein phosphatase [Chromobacterium sp. IIBBL 290-4]
MSLITILLVEDSATNRYFIEQFILELGYGCAIAKNGREAVDYCRGKRPDLILMDVVMPELNGLEATAELRKMFGEHWVPIIFLTSLNELESVVVGLKAGGDDYLTKPISFDLLSAKIHVFLRIAEMQNQINQDAVRLEKYFRENEFEQQLALELIERLIRQQTTTPQHVWQYLSPAAGFNGDLIIVCDNGRGGEHIMLADCTGHGLTAAISALPAIDSFYEMTQAGCALPDIARGVNRKLHQLLPWGRFVAAVFIALDPAGQSIRIWNGGIPCVLLLDPAGELKASSKSAHPPLGILPDGDFDESTQVLEWLPGERLVASSDGITEAKDDKGVMFGLAGVLAGVRDGWPGQVGDAVLASARRHMQDGPASDDISLLVVSHPQEKR